MVEESTLINVHCCNTSESWLLVHADGRIVYHCENNGHRMLRHGLEAVDEDIDMARVAQLGGDALVAKVKAATNATA